MRLNLRHVEAFKALMESGTVSKAADRLHISQPAASKLIAAFEHEIPFKVFVREGGRLSPTPEAQLLYREVERVFGGLSEIERFAHQLADQTRGRLSIGVLPALSIGVIQQIMSGFLSTRPQVQLSLHTRTSMQTTGLLLARKIDLGIMANAPSVPGITRRKLVDARGVCVLPRGHPLADRRVIRATDLHGQDFVSLTALDGSLQRVEATFLRDGITPHVQVETPLSLTACACVAEGMGMSIVDPFTPRAFHGRLHVRAYEPEVFFTLYSCVPSGDNLASSLTRAFQDHLHDGLGRIHTEMTAS